MKSTNRQSPAINAGSMADIAFLLLVFFLVTTTVAKDEGLNRILPPRSEDSGPIPQRNVLEILVNKHNQLLVEGHFTEIENLRATALEFILNLENEPNLPQKRIVTIDQLGTIAISKQVISIQNDALTEYGTYVAIQDALSGAYLDARNILAQEHFNKSYTKLIEEKEIDKVKAIREAIPQRISEAEPNF